jgi:hypothetical protein
MFIGKTISSKAFTFDKTAGRFTTEASDILNSHMSRLWDDSFDFGFAIISAKTGVSVIFTYSDTEIDADGETVCWNYKGWDGDIKLAALTARVYND